MTNHEAHDSRLDTAPTPASLPGADDVRRTEGGRQVRTVALGMALVLGGLIWLVFTLFAPGQLFGGRGSGSVVFDQTLPGTRLEMDVGGADVIVRPWQGQGIHIKAIQYGGASGASAVNVEQSNGTVRVTGSGAPGFSLFCFGGCGLDYQIAIPAGVPIDIRTSSGDISITGADNAATLTTSSGDISARSLTSGLTVSTTSGDVKLDDIAGRLEVTTVSGDVELDNGRVSDAVVQTTNGDIDLQGVANAFTLESVSGDVTVRDARDGQLVVTTTNGNVDYTGSLARGGSNTISTISGDVTLRLPDASSFRLDASTINGDLSSEFALRDEQRDRRFLRGRVGAGEALLKIETTSGNVRLERQ